MPAAPAAYTSPEGVRVVEWRYDCPRGPVWTRPPQGWNWTNCPGQLLAEESLQRVLHDTDWGLVKRDDSGFYLAFPFATGRPFPIPPLFCLCRLETMEDRRYVVFRFSRRGWVEPLA